MRNFQGVHDENTRPVGRTEEMVGVTTEIMKDLDHHTAKTSKMWFPKTVKEHQREMNSPFEDCFPFAGSLCAAL